MSELAAVTYVAEAVAKREHGESPPKIGK